MYNFVNKLMLSRQLLFEEGEIKLLGEPSVMLIPASCFLDLSDKLLEDDGAVHVYVAGKNAGKELFKLISHYTIDPLKTIKFGTQVFNISGFGKIQIVNVNLESKRALFRMRDSLYKNRRSDEPMCHFVRGMLAGFTQNVMKVDMDCVETHCVAMGSDICEFVIKKREDFDKGKEIVKKQLGLVD